MKPIIVGATVALVVFSMIAAVYAMPDIPAHNHGDGWVTWESGGKTDGTTAHQHNWDREFVLNDPADKPSAHEPYSLCGWVWIDRKLYIYETHFPNEPWPHGFIQEVKGSIPTYWFEGDWTDPKAASAKKTIKDVFDWLDKIEATKSITGKPLATGLKFEPAEAEAGADIFIFWENLPGKTLGSVEPAAVQTRWMDVKFDSGPEYEWWFGASEEPHPDKLHFNSVAFHEVGHVIGLGDQNDKDDMMYFQLELNQRDEEHDMIDTDSWWGAEDLYSIPFENATQCVGGAVDLYSMPIGKFGLSAPYIGLGSTITVAAAAAAVYVKRLKRRKTNGV